ncbi:AraC family transcriptional regulator [Kangiella sediminilitoris]|uniref:Transcriptional regulator, AraC family n=1 Tax=Kangiella sediminilitoris TaxID=1144748 RepID=A0A1B3BB61_9GAMM|nr:helix-turn-helix domain-containing protein [Kangiella sediminilitoris]AOE50039.1 Transcriptional regulator, AraC family [Kangiella sediminilitoris]
MSQTQTVILAIGAFQGFLLFLLLVSDKRVNYASRLLGILCLFIATTFVLPLIVAAGKSHFSWLIGFLVFLPACYNGLTYLYCRTAITGSSLKPIDILHLLPLAVCYLLNYDILFAPEKALSFVRMPETTLLKHTLTKIVFYGQAVVYLVLLIEMVRRYQSKAKQTLSSYNPDIFKWLWSLIGFMASIWLLKILSYFIIESPTVTVLADFLLVVLVYFVAIAQWRNPKLFQIRQLSAQLEHSTPSGDKQESRGVLDQDTRSSILHLVQKQVKEKALYRDSELTLATLADQIGVSIHQLSETLNQFGGKNFNQFINEYRVDEVCQQLDKNSKRKLIDMALEAGFSSKSSFNATFKKLTGLTPSQYRQQ